MKFIAPIHIIDYTGAPGGVQSGFRKFYLKDGYFKLYNGTTISDVVLDRPLDDYTPIAGTITANDTVLTALEKLAYAISNVGSNQSLQDIVNTGNSISNFVTGSNADIQSTNFVSNRTLYLNNDAFATIKIVDNLNAAHNLTIDLDTININGVSYNWSSIVSPPSSILLALPFTTDHLAITNNQYIIGDVVYYLGNVYKCLANNDSIIPTSTLYWENVGLGFPIVQQPVDWNSTSGNNQILNKPTIPTVGTWGVLDYPTWTTGTPFVKMTAAGVFALDTNNYITSPLTNKGDIFVRGAADTRLPVGTDGQILTANSSVPEGLSWQDNYADWTSVVKHIVKNNGLSGTITKGTAVYVTSSNGTNMLVGRASNASEPTSSKTIGLMQSNITTTGVTQTGFVVTEGLLGGLNTASATAGDPVWLGVNGALIYGLINKPYAPEHLVFIGIVTKVSSGNGEIFVKVQNGFELKELHDVQAQSPTLKDILWYDSTVSPAQWKTASIATILGYTPANNADVVHTTGTELIAGDKTFTGQTIMQNSQPLRLVSTDYIGGASGTILFVYTPSSFTYSSISSRANGGGLNGDLVLQESSGNVGIGTTTPTFKLEVNGSIKGTTLNIPVPATASILSVDTSGVITVLPTTTYPSLTELSYVRGLSSPIQPQIDAVNVNVITITTSASITTDTTNGTYGQHGRHVKISNGANVINIQCVSTSNADFVASYEKLGTSNITFTAGAGITLTTLSGTAILSGVAGSKACLSRTSGVYYLQITNY